jgi:purine-binding chemotaxis protein CheW
MELVLFDIQDNRFALRASAVSQVLESLAITPLPYAPAEVEGLVNVSGTVLLKIDLALRLGMNARTADSQGNLLVVMTGHENIAVQVDRVHNKINLDESELTTYIDAAQHNLVCGEFMLNERMVLLLDHASLDMRDMDPTGVPQGGGGLIGFDLNDDQRAEKASQASLDMPTVTVEDRDETYALHMTHVQEIVEIAPLTQLPGASAEVQGLMQLRGQALLVVSLAGLLGRPQITTPRFVLVLKVQGLQLGVSVATILGIERYAREDVQTVAGANDAQLEGYLNGAANREGHMTGLLSMTGLLAPHAIANYQRFLTQQTTFMLTNNHLAPSAVRRMLSFRLGNERCALPLALVDRVEEYSPSVDLPEGDKSLSGVIQIKGEIAPVIDLRNMLGVQPLETSSYVVVRVDGEPWALIVDRIERVIDIEERNITPVRNQQNDYLNEVGKLDGGLISLITLAPLTLAAKRQMK